MTGRKGRSGRRKKPTVLKVLQGTNGPKRDDSASQDANPSTALPEPPPWLNTVELVHYQRIGNEALSAGTLAASDGEALALLAAEYQKYLECRNDIEKNGHVLHLETAAGTPTTKRNPASQIMAEAWRNVSSSMRDFGLTPSTRTTLAVDPKPPSGPSRDKWRR